MLRQHLNCPIQIFLTMLKYSLHKLKVIRIVFVGFIFRANWQIEPIEVGRRSLWRCLATAHSYRVLLRR